MSNTIDQKVQSLSNSVAGQNQEVILTKFKEALIDSYNSGLSDFSNAASQLVDKAGRPAPGSKKFVKIADSLKIGE